MAKRSRRRQRRQQQERQEPRGQESADAAGLQQQQPTSHEELAHQQPRQENEENEEPSIVLDSFRELSIEEQDKSINLIVQRTAEDRKKIVLNQLLRLQFEITPYFDLFQQAQQTRETCTEGKECEAVNMFWKAFQQATKLGKWSPGRILILDCAMERIEDHPCAHHCTIAQEIWKLIEEETELTVVRLMAALSLGCWMTWFANILPEEAMEICRAALLLQPTTEEFQRKVAFRNQDTAEGSVSVLESIDVCRDALSRLVSMHLHPEQQELTQVGHAWLLEDKREVIPKEEDAELFCRTAQIGGCKCDCCNTTVEELGVTKLKICGKCQNAYYCGADCQHKAWKEGHSKACRPVGDVRSGDIMRVMGHMKKLDLNGRLVKIVEQRDVTAKVWWVRFFTDSDESKPFLVKTKYLVHIRPEE